MDVDGKPLQRGVTVYWDRDWKGKWFRVQIVDLYPSMRAVRVNDTKRGSLVSVSQLKWEKPEQTPKP